MNGYAAVTVEIDGIVITFPEPTPSVNRLHGYHWSRKKRERTKWGWYARSAALQLGMGAPPARARVEIVRHGARLLDPDNLTAGCKWLIDSLVAERFLMGDTEEHLDLARPRQVAGRERKTVVTIRPLTAERHENGDGV